MQLPAPVTVQPPPFTLPSGTAISLRPMTLSALKVTLVDSAWSKKCEARIALFRAPLTLWEGADYDEAGDYTQAAAEARILALLGPDVKAGLEKLFVPPARPVPTPR